MNAIVLSFVSAAVLGTLSGWFRLWRTYLDAPRGTLYCWPSFVYIGLNTTISILAVWATVEARKQWVQDSPFTIAMFAGGAGIVLLRSAMTSIPVESRNRMSGSKLVGLLELFLETADKAIEIRRKCAVLDQCGPELREVDFLKCAEYLLKMLVDGQSDFDKRTKQKIRQQVKELGELKLDEHTRCVQLVFLLSDYMSLDILLAAIRTVDLKRNIVDKFGGASSVSINEMKELYASGGTSLENRR